MSEENTAPATEAATEAPAEKRSRGESLLETRNRKMGELFKDRKYRIMQEVHLEPGEVFETPFGHKGRHGWILVEVDKASPENDAVPEYKFVVGGTVLKVAQEEYSALRDGLPENFGKSARQIKAEAKAAEEAAAPAATEPETVSA